MLQQKHGDLSFREIHVFTFALSEEATEPDDGDVDAPLDDAARDEREYVRGRLREELQREPTESELDEWLRQHTEGY